MTLAVSRSFLIKFNIVVYDFDRKIITMTLRESDFQLLINGFNF